VVRQATLADVEAIARVHVRGWQRAYAHVFAAEDLAGLSVERRVGGWRQAVDEEILLVAEREGVVAGFASAGPSRDDESVGELYAIYVDPDVLGTGVGRELIEEVERRLVAAGFSDAELWVLEDNPRARRFYEAAGWKPGDTRPIEVFGTEVPEIRYRKHLV
jgi:ribosomal protein S18 acetylase RimI-like enzyme